MSRYEHAASAPAATSASPAARRNKGLGCEPAGAIRTRLIDSFDVFRSELEICGSEVAFEARFLGACRDNNDTFRFRPSHEDLVRSRVQAGRNA